MKSAALPANEAERLKALAQYQLLDTLPEEVYDDITKIASEIAGTPIALLSLIDADRHWVKSRQGFEAGQMPREYSFCAHAILDPNEMLVVEDARYDERFHDNPMVTSTPHVVFYAGVPIVNEDGYALGSLCIIDNRPRTLADNKVLALKALAKLIMAHFELRRSRLELERIHKELNKVSHKVTPSHLVLPEQAQVLVDRILANVQSLSENATRAEQNSHLNSLQEAAQALKNTLQAPDDPKADTGSMA